MRYFVPLVGMALAAAAPAWPQNQPAISDSQTLERNGDVQMARKLYREAVESFGQLVKKDPKNPVAWNKLGIAHHQLLDFSGARVCYERAVRVNPKYAEAINNLGTIYYSQKNFKKAIRMYEKSLELTPNAASVHSNLGTALFARKKLDDAFGEYRKALALDPEVFEHHSTYGVLLQERSVDDWALFHFFLAKAQASSGNLELSLMYLRKALEEGFKETKKIYEDPVFAELIKSAPFTELMANPPVAIPR